MKNFNLILAAALIAVIGLQSCKKDTPTVGKTVVVDAKSYTEWVYYSLSIGDTVSVTTPSSDKTWDLALMRNHFRTNSGTSGSGQGGAYDANTSDLAAITEAKESGYTIDISTIEHYVLQFIPPSTMNIDTIQISANPILETWGQFDYSVQPAKFNLNKKTFVIKTAAGKFAKIAFLNYYDAEGSGGTITFEYKYQEDGTTNVE